MNRAKGPYLDGLKREDCPELEPTWKALESLLGFVPNTELIMARMPRSTKVLIELVGVFFSTATLPPELLSLVGLLSSSTAGCEYCASHNVSKANDDGADMEKVAAVWEFETSPLYSEAERAALAFTIKASQSPSGVEKGDYDRMFEFYTETEVTEILALISIFGVFNRFNNSVATTIEAVPMMLAKKHLSPDNWQAGVHDS